MAKNQTCINAATQLLNMGIATIPIGADKHPPFANWQLNPLRTVNDIETVYTDGWFHSDWTVRLKDGSVATKKDTSHKGAADYQLGILNGKTEGFLNAVVTIDCDFKTELGINGYETLQDWQREHGQFNETVSDMVNGVSPHIYYVLTDDKIREHGLVGLLRNMSQEESNDKYPGIDIRWTGGCSVSAPTQYADGRIREWEYPPDEYEFQEANDFVYLFLKDYFDALGGSVPTGNHNKERREEKSTGLVEGEGRNQAVFNLAFQLSRDGYAHEKVWLFTETLNKTFYPPLDKEEFERTVQSALRYNPEYPLPLFAQSNTAQGETLSEDLRRFHHFNAKNIPTSVYDFEVFQFICKKMHIVILGGTPYIYKQGVFIPDQNGSRLKTAIRQLIYPPLIKSTTIDRVYRLFLGDASLQVEANHFNRYPPHWINFQNGFFDPIEKKIIPHDPKYLAINQIPHQYNPDIVLNGEETEKWLAFITPNPDDREMLLEFLGYCLTADTRQQKFLILVGVGGTGKSTLIKIIEYVVGFENLSNISLKDFSGNRFASYGLLGKLINTCADLEITALEDTSVIKKILGEDTLRAEAKGKDAVSFRNYAKLIFSTNELPLVLSEKTNGFFRRLLILTMNREPEVRRADYTEVLTREGDYFIHLIVQALGRMYESGRIVESKSSKQAVQNLWFESDTVKAWLDDHCITETVVPGHKPKPLDKEFHKVEQTRLYHDYELWCLANDRKELSAANFYKSLRLKRFEQRKTNGIRYFLGIDFNDEVYQRKNEEQWKQELRQKTQKTTYYN